jgi:hypothetical protein
VEHKFEIKVPILILLWGAYEASNPARSRGARRRSMWALPRLRGTASSWNKLADQLFLGWPIRSVTRPATVWKKSKASAPQPREVSTAMGRKRMPTVWQSAVFLLGVGVVCEKKAASLFPTS